MDKTVLITGGSGAIGTACARKMREEGFKVLLHYNSGEESARRTAEQLDAKIFRADFSVPQETERMCREILGECGKIDLLINAAGAGESGLFTDFSDGHIRRILEINLISAMTVCRAFIPSMVSERRGAIINISSMWGISGASCEAVYSAAKAGLIGFTKALARELAPSNVRVNAIAPGVIDTPMNKGLTQDAVRELAAMTPLGRLGTPKDIADAAAYLYAAEFVTGQVLVVDGGFLN